MNTPIVLIGPMCAGKSTVAKLLAESLHLPRVELDELRWEYYPEAGYDADEARRIHAEAGNLGVLAYCKPFEVYAVERIVQDYCNAVIDFGAGHTVQKDAVLFNRIEQALSPLPHIFLLLPTPDLDRSSQILNHRFRLLLDQEVGEIDEKLLRLNEHFVKHPSNAILAKHVVYTDGQTPEETSQEILTIMGSEEELRI